MTENTAPTNGLRQDANPSASPASSGRRRGGVPALVAHRRRANNPSAQAIECWGLYQIDLGKQSIRSPCSHQDVKPSMFHSLTTCSGMPRWTIRTSAHDPSALDATTPTIAATAAVQAPGTALRTNRKSMATTSTAEHTALALSA